MSINALIATWQSRFEQLSQAEQDELLMDELGLSAKALPFLKPKARVQDLAFAAESRWGELTESHRKGRDAAYH
jgi:hypothetical protein